MHKITKTKRGFTLTEAAIVLGCVGAVLSGVWAAASAVQENRRIELGSSQISMVADAVRNIYTGQVNAAVPAVTGSTSSLACSGVFPRDSMIGSGTYACSSWTPTTPWGGTMGVAFRTTGSKIDGSFTVGFANTPARALTKRSCIDLVSRLRPTLVSSSTASTSTVSGGSISLPVLSSLPALDTAQGGGPLKAYISDGSWHDVTSMNPTEIMQNVLSSAQCQGVAFAYAL